MITNNKTSADEQARRFAALKSFYRNQIAETSSTFSPSDPLDYTRAGLSSSPGSLNRIMSIYASSRSSGAKKPKSKSTVMREAVPGSNEGIYIPQPDADDAIIQRMEKCGWDGLASVDQRVACCSNTRFVDDLLPSPVLLRTKRAKRCKTCKHILVKPESKPQSTRFRMRLIALNFIPLATLRPLSLLNLDALVSLKPIQLLLTLKNNMFDPVRITLATPSVTPGVVSTKVTILCPQFEIGANNDAWDEADEVLQQSAKASIAATRIGDKEKVAEAGKVWEKGRNWSAVVLEVVPGVLPVSASPPLGIIPSPHDDDQDVLEIPIFVRMEWDSESHTIEHAGKGDNMVKRELAYWMVLGVGRIGHLPAS